MRENGAEGAGEPAAVRYALDAGRSMFTVRGTASGLLAGFGHDPTVAIRDFAGEARFVPGSLAGASVRIVVPVGSLAVVGDVPEKDRRDIERTMFDEVLEAGRYPEAVFESTSVAATRVAEGRYRARIVGDLTLHGVTRRALWILAHLSATVDEIRAHGDLTLKQSDFGIKPVSVAAGALRLNDELRFAFDVLGRRAAED